MKMKLDSGTLCPSYFATFQLLCNFAPCSLMCCRLSIRVHFVTRLPFSQVPKAVRAVVGVWSAKSGAGSFSLRGWLSVCIVQSVASWAGRFGGRGCRGLSVAKSKNARGCKYI